jgi:hypothetical protein
MEKLYKWIAFIIIFHSTAVFAQVPQLNSYPGSSAVVYLDFDGHTVNGTSWNVAGPINCAPSGLDQMQVIEVFNRIAEDYRPFAINVTTDSTKFLVAPVDRRMRVIFTISSQWYGNAGGVAFVGSFIWGDDTPCFVFTALLSYNPKNVAEAGAHEAGHTLGLYHQAVYDGSCNRVSEYNLGQGSGEIGWAPIMGAAYYQNFTLWSNGPNNFGCTNYQTELEILTSANGFGYRPDDHKDIFDSATNTSVSNNRFLIDGTIEKNTDRDLFKFIQASASRFVLSGMPYSVGTGNQGSNLDMQVSLYNGSQHLLNVYNPGLLLNSVIDTILNTGTYYLRIEGRGNIYAPNYASLGSYSLQGDFSPAMPLPLRKLELQGRNNIDRHEFSWIIDADETVVDQRIEVSGDGRNFEMLSSLQAPDRSFQYNPTLNGNLQYRLKVKFDNGREHYSNIVTLRSVNENSPQLIGNPVSGSVVTIKSPSRMNYSIYDMKGRIIKQSKVERGINQINSGMISNGVYVIRFDNGDNEWRLRFVKSN